MDLMEKYSFSLNEEGIMSSIQTIVSNLDSMSSTEILKKCFASMDLTSLHCYDTEASIAKFVEKANGVKDAYSGYPYPSSICVFSNFVPVVKAHRCDSQIHVTAAAGSFPDSQNFLEVKIKECEMCVEAGVDEIDIVLALNAFMAGEYERAFDEIVAIKAAIDAAAQKQGRKVVLKVILETGVLKTPEAIAKASFLAMEAGADFIKTSTGRVDVNATPAAAYVMCQCIKKYYEATGRKVGFKAAGGISTAKDALCYYFIVSSVLGPEWICRELFRLGVSRLGNNLMGAIEQQTISYF